MVLLNEMECSGCGACAGICPGGCIALQCAPNGDGRPVIDVSRCVGCGLCAKVCPQMNAAVLKAPSACYAAVRGDGEARADSASGGVGALLGEAFLARHPGGAVCGVRWNGDSERVEYAVARERVQLEAFKGSKYVQPDANGIYRSAVRLLKEGREVLFFGLPCHVAACRRVVDALNVPQEKLTCVDLLCHGVSSHVFLTEELQWLKRKRRFARIDRITFRSNRKDRNFHFVAEGADKKGRVRVYDRAVGEDCYFRSFLDGVSLREACVRCKFACGERCGDLTIGDFIGLGRQAASTPYDGEMRNVSMVLVNTEKGETALEEIRNGLLLSERPYEEAVQGGASLQAPFPRHPERDRFVKEYQARGFMKAARATMGKALLMSRVKHALRRAANRLGIETDALERIIRKGK